MTDDEESPISAAQARTIFAPWKAVPAVVLAVSGGPDSVALMWLAARWRRGLRRGPRLIAVTVDHGLRAEAAREARDVKRLARALERRASHAALDRRQAETGIAGCGARGALPRCWPRRRAPAAPRMSSPPIPATIRPRRC